MPPTRGCQPRHRLRWISASAFGLAGASGVNRRGHPLAPLASAVAGSTARPEWQTGRPFGPTRLPSGRLDLNQRLPAPKAGALAKLSYAPRDDQIRNTKHETRNTTTAQPGT